MTWVIACFCGHVIDTPTCPHCGSGLPEFADDSQAPPALRLAQASADASVVANEAPPAHRRAA
jgi:hypothetical protein